MAPVAIPQSLGTPTPDHPRGANQSGNVDLRRVQQMVFERLLLRRPRHYTFLEETTAMDTSVHLYAYPVTGPDQDKDTKCYVCDSAGSPILAAFIRLDSPRRN